MEDAQDDVVLTKKRGRPSNPNTVKKEKTGRPRGRPSKNSDGSPIIKKQTKAASNDDTGSEADEDMIDDKKRGRPKKESKAKIAPTVATGRGRGRPKAQNGGTKTNGTPVKKSPQKTGRPQKEEDDDEASDVSKDKDEDVEEPLQTVSKGRSKKDVKKRGTSEPSTDENTTPKKRGRKSIPQKTSSGKKTSRGRAKAKNDAESADENMEDINDASENEEDASAINLVNDDPDDDEGEEDGDE